MRILTNKSKTVTIALVLMLTIAAMLVALPATTAQEPPRRKTYALIGATPNPIGVGQQVLLHVGITDTIAWPQPGWYDLTVTVTRPDNTTETLGPFQTDTTGGTGAIYVPSQVGTYYFQTHFPEQISTTSSRGVPPGTVFEASSSEKLALIVTEEQREYYPGSPLPTEYWTRPIDAQHREWHTIAGNWLEGASAGKGYYHDMEAHYNDDAPETTHILWAKPIQMGGLAGGAIPGPQAFECGNAYEGLFLDSVIIGGVLCYNQFKSAGGDRVEQIVVAVDLHTGEELWARPLVDSENVTHRLEFGQVFYWDSYNYHAAFPYLWATDGDTWHAFDPFSGRWVYSMTDVPSGTNIYGSKGEIYRYTVDLDGWMTLWNTSRVVDLDRPGYTPGSWLRNDMGTVINGTRGIEWNKTIPTGLPGRVRAVLEDRIIGSDFSRSAPAPETIAFWAISTKKGQEGQLLFNRTWSVPNPDTYMNIEGVSVEDGVFTVVVAELRQHYGFSLDTGANLWGPTESQVYLDRYGFASGSNYDFIYDGKLFSASVGGIVSCYNATTGVRKWTYEATDPYTEILWSDNWPIYWSFVADGKLYFSHGEHSPIDPKPRGGPFICLDAETGEEVWRIDGAFIAGRSSKSAIIGDSIIALNNDYDQRIYAIGKGPSATTVTAPQTVIPHGSSIMITGTVTDESPGTKEYGLTARFPNGVPAIADDDMSEWMKYVYMQFAIPAEVTGVEVSLDTIDPNGNWIHIGTVTSDMSGMFKKMFTPEVPGEYTIIATFMGSKSYYASYAETAIGVGPAPEEPATPGGVQRDIDQSAENLMNSLTPILYGIVAAIVVVAILVVYTLWTVRKQRK